MDSIHIDLKELFPYAIEAYTAIFGEEYHEMISEQINSVEIIQYHDVEGIKDYIRFLRICKTVELSVRFLKEIGIQLPNEQNINYTEPLDENTQKLLEVLLGNSFLAFSDSDEFDTPLKAFNHDDAKNPKLLHDKINLINFLLGFEDKKINQDNFLIFSQTEEYKELSKKINEYRQVYERLVSDYKKWEDALLPFKLYVKSEQKRKEDIFQKKKTKLFIDKIYEMPKDVINAISGKSLKEQEEAIFGKLDISFSLPTEYFSSEKMDELKSLYVSNTKKATIINMQLKYLRNLGIIISDEVIPDENFEKGILNISKYFAFLNEEHIKKYIPSEEAIKSISATQEEKVAEAINEYYMTREDCLEAIQRFGSEKVIYNTIKSKRVCIAPGRNLETNKIFPIMFFTIRPDDGGTLFHTFMHELGHSIDLSSRAGFDSYEGQDDLNPYDERFRKYEKFNETLTDIFTIEATSYLQNKGIYLIEPQELTTKDKSNRNTASITKELLNPLLQKYRIFVIRAKVNSEPVELIKYIGEDNFEDLVDIVNKVDHLSRNGLMRKIKNSIDDSMTKDYFKELERLKQIYANIDTYYNNNYGDISIDESKPKF